MAVKASLVDRLAEKARLESLLDTATPSSIHPISVWTQQNETDKSLMFTVLVRNPALCSTRHV
jgi:hypothetical protein